MQCLQAEMTAIVDDNRILENKLEDVEVSVNYWREEVWRLEAKVKEFEGKLENL
jgi:hypothetical protein